MERSSAKALDRLFRSLKSNDDRSVMYKRLEEFDGTIAVPINVGLKSSHWTLATVSGRGPDLRVTYVDPLSGKPDRHARKAIELAVFQADRGEHQINRHIRVVTGPPQVDKVPGTRGGPLWSCGVRVWMQVETLRYEGSLEESVNAWPYSLVKLVDDRLCRILENNAYIAPSREERALGYCLSSEDDAAETNLLVNVDNDKIPLDSDAFDWLVVPHPPWFSNEGTREDQDIVRDLMTSPSKLTIAVELQGLWWLARVERVDRRAHVLSWGGEGGSRTNLRLVGYPEKEKLQRFVFLRQRNGLDKEDVPLALFCKLKEENSGHLLPEVVYQKAISSGFHKQRNVIPFTHLLLPLFFNYL